MADGRRILLTNDDGYASEGIQALADSLEPVAEVWVVAPRIEQSAVSHALTLDRPLHIERLGERRFAVDGTPTDCVALGVASLMVVSPPDLVVSGINFGANMGVDVHYSGTVSAAFEGVILGCPALAVSQVRGEGFSFHVAAAIACRLAEWILDRGLAADTLLNVNVPVGRPRGVKLTRLGVRRYTEGVIEQVDPRGKQIYWIGGGEPVWEEIPGTDFHEVAAGYVSVTPLHLDMTDLRGLEALEAARPPWVGPWAPGERDR
ncbi:MAG TPA: 5'/3'-nucleotidase SurE [Thermoanaerobaculales bacterium]|nr:5'/3'-nucleotidase SurE [Thermoanaerobaculales bacterium]HPA80857.1 5'/3'-nucleotidase SurE [Thermoanaerobaculales bacterium]HQL30686.1 5'/3'-nucleotidase SurE [Thermoanaerobaculales bacterium]HQN96657.1 5'/3'-nucleotidase SurE [Thermoanaerobaculales bacterium]HQP44942.1 5'/3'-nucleotidase SurE [Thermoanaerobaculales bacterium]